MPQTFILSYWLLGPIIVCKCIRYMHIKIPCQGTADTRFHAWCKLRKHSLHCVYVLYGIVCTCFATTALQRGVSILKFGIDYVLFLTQFTTYRRT